MKNLVQYLTTRLPETTLVWSDILPRNWGNQDKGLFRACKRVNAFMISQVKRVNGFYIRHINLATYDEVNYLHDGVHLSGIGTEKFLSNIEFGMGHILQGTQPWFE